MSGTWLAERVGKVGVGGLRWEDLSSLVMIAQEELDVTVDGKPGAKTLAALAERFSDGSRPVPVPRNRAEIRNVYGNPTWVKLPRGRAVDLEDAWEKKNIRWFRLHTGKRVRMHRLVGPEFVRLFAEACEKSGYTPKSVQTYNPRIIGGTNNRGRRGRLSMHAYGVAADFDPRYNAMGARNLVDPSKPTLLEQHPEFLQTFRDAKWVCGHDWKMKDTMHIQRGG